MIIKEGYWNYYLAFRIENYQKHLQEMTKEKMLSGIVAYIADEHTLVSKKLSDIMSIRKKNVYACKEALDSKETLENLHEMYAQNNLPECFFDFDESMNDLLDKYIADCIGHVEFINGGYRNIIRSVGEGKNGYYVLMPLKLYYTEWDYVYCPIYIELLTNGNGMIKLEVPLRDMEMELFSTYPLKRWFSHIKVWEELFFVGGEEKYKVVGGDTNGIEDVMGTLMNIVQNIFSESIVDEHRFLGFETFVISKSDKKDIIKISDKDKSNLQELYHFCYPENFAISAQSDELLDFWKNARFNANGIQVLKGDRARLIMYADVEKLLAVHNRDDVNDINDYLQNTVAGTFDAFILLALAQKDNEISIYRIAEPDRHAINVRMTQYYANVNYLNGILQGVPKHGMIFYNKVREMLDEYSVDFRQMLQHMQNIEEYDKLRLNEKQNTLINRFTLVFTVLFGLPLIQETLLTIREILGIKIDIIPILTTGHFGMIIWLVLVFFMLTDNVDNHLEYEGMKIENPSSIVGRFKRLLLLIYVWIKRKRKK